LAALLRFSRQTINALETGRYSPSLPLAFAFARHFATTVDALFDPSESAQKR
jgi:putative transcriptional regulator